VHDLHGDEVIEDEDHRLSWVQTLRNLNELTGVPVDVFGVATKISKGCDAVSDPDPGHIGANRVNNPEDGVTGGERELGKPGAVSPPNLDIVLNHGHSLNLDTRFSLLREAEVVLHNLQHLGSSLGGGNYAFIFLHEVVYLQ
jgi:hypothetical protein